MLSTLLAFCERNTMLTSGLVDSSHREAVIQSFGVSFVVSLVKLLSKQWSCHWFELLYYNMEKWDLYHFIVSAFCGEFTYAYGYWFISYLDMSVPEWRDCKGYIVTNNVVPAKILLLWWMILFDPWLLNECSLYIIYMWCLKQFSTQGPCLPKFNLVMEPYYSSVSVESLFVELFAEWEPNCHYTPRNEV